MRHGICVSKETNCTMIKALFFTLIVSCSLSLHAQTIGLPDSADIVRNKVKQVRVYFKSEDGKRHEQKQARYNKLGQIVMERESVNSYYYENRYDNKGRKTYSAQRTKEGAIIQMFTQEYNSKDGTKKVTLYFTHDTVNPSHVYVYDANERKIREDAYNSNGLGYTTTMTYDKDGNVIANTDSSGAIRTINFREKGQLVLKRTYDPNNGLLHQYRYKYGEHYRFIELIDSTGLIPKVHYVFVYDKITGFKHIERNKDIMKSEEESNFRKEFDYLFPYRTEYGEDYGLPPGEMQNIHHFTYDKNGLILRDDLEQKMGSMSEKYLYEYEYAFW